MTFPRMNLPSEATPWGRSIENSLQTSEKSYRKVAQAFQNSTKSLSGGMSSTSEQLKEVAARSSAYQYQDELIQRVTIPNLADVTVPRISTVLSNPTPDGQNRVFLATAYAQLYNSADVMDITTFAAGIEFLASRGVVRQYGTAPRPTSTPAGWSSEISGFLLGETRGGTAEVEISVQGSCSNYSGSSKTVDLGLREIRVFFTFLERV